MCVLREGKLVFEKIGTGFFNPKNFSLFLFISTRVLGKVPYFFHTPNLFCWPISSMCSLVDLLQYMYVKVSL